MRQRVKGVSKSGLKRDGGVRSGSGSGFGSGFVFASLQLVSLREEKEGRRRRIAGFEFADV